MIPVGMGEYWLGGNNLAVARPFTLEGAEWLTGFVLELVLLALGLRFFWQRRGDPVLRTVGVIFIGTLAAGQVMNAHAEPGDPQMQINVMAWLTVAWTLLLGASLTRRRLLGPLAILSIVPLGWNLYTLASHRGGDALALDDGRVGGRGGGANRHCHWAPADGRCCRALAGLPQACKASNIR